MPFVPTAVVDGTTMQWSAVQTNIDDARTWLNLIPDADISVGGVRREHLVRPQIKGWPVEGVEGGVQAAYGSDFGTNLPDVFQDSEWGNTPERITIVPTVSDGVSRTIRTAAAKTFYVWQDNYVSVVLTADMLIRSNTANYRHPFGAGPGVDTLGGYFSLHFYDLQQRTENELQGSRRWVYVMDDTTIASVFHNGSLVLYGNRQLTQAGWHEVQLCYHLNAAASPIEQIDLTRLQLHTEVL